MTLRLFLLTCFLFLSGLIGCAKVKPEERLRYVWPPLSTEAKIEYLGFYASEANLKGALFTNISEIVFGLEPAKPIFISPFAVDAWKSRVLVTDSGSRRTFLLDLKKRELRPISRTFEDPKQVSVPTGVSIIDEAEFLVVDTVSARVDRFSFDGDYMSSLGEGLLTRPVSVTVDRPNRRVIVVDTGAHRLSIFSLDHGFIGHIGERGDGPGKFNFPIDADVSKEGDLFVLDSMNFRVQRFSWDDGSYRYVKEFGEIGTAEGSFSRPKALAVSASGHVYVTDALGHKVIVFDQNGNFLLTFGRKFVASASKMAPGGLHMPAGIAADDQDGIWVIDSLNRMVHHFQYLNATYLQDHPLSLEFLAPPGGGAER